MRALLDEFAVVEDADEIGVADRAEAVGDDEGGEVRAEVVEGLLDEFLGGVVEGGGDLVQQQERGFSSSVRAMERRCFSPPEKRMPRSPIMVSRPLGRARMKSAALANFSAAHSSSAGSAGCVGLGGAWGDSE